MCIFSAILCGQNRTRGITVEVNASSTSEELVVTPSTSTTPDIVGPRSTSTESEMSRTEDSNRADLIRAVKDTLRKPKDATTQKALDNTKINYKIKKGSGVILTNEDAIKALRSKEEQTKKKKDQIEKKANNEKNKTTQIDNNSAKITRYFKPRICKRKGKESPVNRSCVKKKNEFTSDNSDSVNKPSNMLSSKSESNDFIVPFDKDDVDVILKQFWLSLSPPNIEKDIVGKFYAAIYVDSKGRQSYCIGRATKRFLTGQEEKASNLELDCLKPHVGNNIMMEEYPEDQSDVYIFHISDIFAGPVYMEPLPQRKWNVPKLNEIVNYFDKLARIDRMALYMEI